MPIISNADFHRRIYYDRRRKIILRSILACMIVLFLLLLVVGYPRLLYARELQREMHTRTAYGALLVSPALSPGGPTYGPGKLADLEMTDQGWEWDGPRGKPTTHSFVFVGIHNKSDHAWSHLEIEMAIYDHQGHFLRIEPSSFGALAAGETVTRHFGPVEQEDAMFRVIGFKEK